MRPRRSHLRSPFLGAVLQQVLQKVVVILHRNCFLVANAIAFVSVAVMLVHSPVTLVVGRLFQGFCTGLFSAFVPLYINEITTPDLAKLGTLHQIGIAVCQAFNCLLYFVLSKLTDSQPTQWFWVSEYILIIIAFQSFVFLKVFSFETPRYLYDHNRV